MMERLIVYAFPGSEYVGAVLAGLQSRNIKHAVQFVSLNPKKRVLPSGGKLVPEITYENPEKGIEPTVVPDSAEIFRFLDNTQELEHQFHPDGLENYAALQHQCSVTLDAFVLYYSWVYNPTYSISMRPRLQKLLPLQGMLGSSGFLKGLGSFAVDQMTKSIRHGIKLKINKELEFVPPESDDFRVDNAVDDTIEPEVYAALVDLLSETVSPFVVARRKSNPEDFHKQLTSVECYAYSMLNRMLGTMGDVNFTPTLAERLSTEQGLEDLYEWFKELEKRLPLQYLHKRPRAVYGDDQAAEASK